MHKVEIVHARISSCNQLIRSKKEKYLTLRCVSGKLGAIFNCPFEMIISYILLWQILPLTNLLWIKRKLIWASRVWICFPNQQSKIYNSSVNNSSTKNMLARALKLILVIQTIIPIQHKAFKCINMLYFYVTYKNEKLFQFRCEILVLKGLSTNALRTNNTYK